MQFQAAVGRRKVVQCEFITAGLELAAGGWRADNLYCTDPLRKLLVNVSEYRGANVSRIGNQPQERIAVLEADLVQPFAADWQWRMMQANQRMRGAGSCKGLVEPVQLGVCNQTPGLAGNAAVDTDDKPVPDTDFRAVPEWSARHCLAHQLPDIVVARDAMNRQAEWLEYLAEPVIGCGGIVLNQVAGDCDKVRRPAGLADTPDDRGKRRVRDRAAQAGLLVGEQMRVSNLQDPYRLRLDLNSATARRFRGTARDQWMTVTLSSS